MRKMCLVLMAMCCPLGTANRDAFAGTIDFSLVNLSALQSSAGQDFSFLVGLGPQTGSVNVKLLTSSIITVGPGYSPDTKGLYISQSSNQVAPILLHFEFNSAYAFEISENELLANADRNSFTLPSGLWTVKSSANAIISNVGTTLNVRGAQNSPPWGTYTIAANAHSFDFGINNVPSVFGNYGSSISLAVVPEPSTATMAIIATVGIALVRFRRRQSHYRTRNA